jgi:hypothetical protein
VLRGSGPKGCLEKYTALAKKHLLRSNVNTSTDLPHSKPAWVGLREMEEGWKVYGLVELQERFGLCLFEWDGK